jgi:hypothetical protein
LHWEYTGKAIVCQGNLSREFEHKMLLEGWGHIFKCQLGIIGST